MYAVMTKPVTHNTAAHAAPPSVGHDTPADQQVVDRIDPGIEAGDHKNGAAQCDEQRLQMPIAELEAFAAFLGEQVRDGKRGERQQHIDEAVHAVENQRLGAGHQAGDDPEQSDDHCDRNGALERSLFFVVLHPFDRPVGDSSRWRQ